MRVLYVHQHFSTSDGATGTRSYSMARELVERGHDVTMVCGSHRLASTGVRGANSLGIRRGIVDGIDVIEISVGHSNCDGLPRRVAAFLWFSLRSSWIALMTRHDIVIATSTPLTAGIPGIVSKIIRRRKFVFEVRDLWPELPRAMGVINNPVALWMMSVLEWCCCRSADRCIGLAPGIVDGIARTGVPTDRIDMIPNASDLDLFDPAHARRGRGTGELVAVFTGTHGRANGLEAVLDAASELRRRDVTSIKLVLAGDGGLKQTLMRRAEAGGLTNVEFVDPMPKKALAEWMRHVHVGLMVLADVPAFYQGTSPNKFFDYLASGLPVICNYPGWVAGLIERHQCGIAIPPRDAIAFADALQALQSDPAMRQSMGRNARHLAESKFDRRRMAARLADVLEGLS